MLITYHSHSCVRISTRSHEVLVDPFFTGNPAAQTSADDVPADFILLTHGHQDHVGDTEAIARRTGATVVANYEIASYFGHKGLSTHGMSIGGAHDFAFGRLKLTIAHHGSGYPGPDGNMLYFGQPAGLLISAEEKTVYHAGDTALFLDMKLIGERHPIDLAILPIGDNFTMGVDDALHALELLKPKSVLPVHYNTFELIRADVDGFAKGAEQRGVRPVVPEVDRPFEL
ncbi:MAG: metal-dependent hydrolase [Puniceicoccaceae bacterium]|nr:MAG: metal-dependent hydrolase [Puniceicoccaceae bacterium]